MKAIIPPPICSLLTGEYKKASIERIPSPNYDGFSFVEEQYNFFFVYYGNPLIRFFNFGFGSLVAIYLHFYTSEDKNNNTKTVSNSFFSPIILIVIAISIFSPLFFATIFGKNGFSSTKILLFSYCIKNLCCFFFCFSSFEYSYSCSSFSSFPSSQKILVSSNIDFFCGQHLCFLCFPLSFGNSLDRLRKRVFLFF